MRIAVYSGSFDPLHEGHLAILKILNQRFDKVLLIISPQSPFKNRNKALNSEERLAAAAESLKEHRELTKVELCDIEFRMSAPHYTYRTLKALQEQYPQDELCLAIGADNLACFDKWMNYSEILLRYRVLVFPRRGFDSLAEQGRLKAENPEYKIELAEMEMVDISSTELRKKMGRE
ncbi:MAG: nicotinate (nicotinamide) nucleotide adenylyltransferase [Candidatus Cryptobacteroides sp.]